MFILSNILASIFWGFIITVVIVGGVYLLCQTLISYRVNSPLSLVILLLLFVLVGAQSTMLVGALYAKGYVSDIGRYANTLVATGSDAAQSATDLERVRRQVEDQFPMAKPVLDRIDTSGLEQYVAAGHSVVDYMTDELKSTINYYMLRRALWLLGFVLAALVGILLLNRPRDYSLDSTATFDYY